MTALEIVIGIVLLVASLFLVVVVMLQDKAKRGLSGAIAGGSDTFFDKNKGRTMESKIARITKFFAAIFFVVALAAVILFAFVK